MNLIEQLGGYNAAILKRHVNYLNDMVDECLNYALLQYRRENNIFEVGDKVVFTDDFMHDEIMTASDVNDAEIYMDDDGKRAILAMVRHATDAEIKANKREVG